MQPINGIRESERAKQNKEWVEIMLLIKKDDKPDPTQENKRLYLKRYKYWRAWLAQSVEHLTLDLRVLSLRPILGIEIKKIFFEKRRKV